MTDKQIDIVEKLAEWSQELVLKEDDTISLNLIGLDIYIKGVCTKDNIYFPASELNCIINRLIEKEQECEGLKEEIKKHNDDMFKNPPEKKFYCKGCTLPYISKKLKAENEILKEKFEIAIKDNMDKTLLRLENGDVKEELQEIREEFGIETLYCHDDNTRVHRCLDVLRLKDALAEIKEIAEHCMKQDICTTCDNSDKCHIEDEEIPTYDVCKLILQKISKCEGNDE